jgi:hypothetical protein
VHARFPSGGGGGYSNIYALFLPPGQDTCLESTACYSPDNPLTFLFCGYHASMDATDALGQPIHVLYAIIPYANVPFCQVKIPPFPNGQLADSTNDLLSHEILEVITDPDMNAWYYSSTGGEIGDLCRMDREIFTINGTLYEIQTEYDNRTHGCVSSVPLPSGGFHVSPATDIVASGPEGGPFAPSSFFYHIEAPKGLEWGILPLPYWMSAVLVGGEGPANIWIDVSPNAKSLPPGTYSSWISFSTKLNGAGLEFRNVTLTVTKRP